jgi:hypothetical protein
MKTLKLVLYLVFIFFASGCEEDIRFPIKELETKNGYYQWYYYSLITNDSPDHIDFIDSNCERTLVYKGHNIIDIALDDGKLNIECYNCDTLEFNPISQNPIQIIENDNNKVLAKFMRERDSIERNLILKSCE